MSSRAPAPAPLAVDVSTAARMLGISRSGLYPLVMSGQIQSAMVTPRRRVIPVSALVDWLQRQPRSEAPR